MAVKDLTKLLKGYENKWVSIAKNEKKIIASAGSLETLLRRIKAKGDPSGFIYRVPDNRYSAYVG